MEARKYKLQLTYLLRDLKNIDEFRRGKNLTILTTKMQNNN
jgi:hypothetical protein